MIVLSAGEQRDGRVEGGGGRKSKVREEERERGRSSSRKGKERLAYRLTTCRHQPTLDC